jgi:hypothetical protein
MFQILSGDVSQSFQFVVVDILSLALGKAVKKERAIFGSVRDDHAKAPRSPLSRSSDPLLDKATAEICVDKTTLGPQDCLCQTRIINALAPDKSRDPLGLENPHRYFLSLSAL